MRVAVLAPINSSVYAQLVCLYLCNEQAVDLTDILLQKKLQLRIDDTFRSIRTRLESMMADLVLEGIHSIMDNKITPIEQKPEEGKQYFVMHPRMQFYAGHKLNNYLEQLDKR